MRMVELLLRQLRGKDAQPAPRPPDTPATIPHLACPIAHLAGPGTLGLDNQRLCFATPDAPQLFLDPQALQEIICYGNVHITAAAMRMLTARGVHVALLTAHGDAFIGRWDPGNTSRTLLRLIQYHVMLKPDVALELARSHVVAKVESQISAARHYQRQGMSPAAEVLRRPLRHTPPLGRPAGQWACHGRRPPAL